MSSPDAPLLPHGALEAVSDLVWRTSRALDRLDGSSYDGARRRVQAVSTALREASDQVGLDSPAAWRIVDLQAEIDSHLVAADAMFHPGPGADAAMLMLRRGMAVVAEAFGRTPVVSPPEPNTAPVDHTGAVVRPG